MSQPQELRNERLRIHLNYIRHLLRLLAAGEYDDCDRKLLDELEERTDDIKTAIEIARKSFR